MEVVEVWLVGDALSLGFSFLEGVLESVPEVFSELMLEPMMEGGKLLVKLIGAQKRAR